MDHSTHAVALAPSAQHDEAIRVERFQALEPGSYWRYLGKRDADAPGGRKSVLRSCPIGTVLLMQDLKMYEGRPHTVVMLSHPRSSYPDSTSQWLVDEFLDQWEYEPDGEAVRQRELMELQGEIAQAQQELMEAQTNPALVAPVVAERLLKWEAEYTKREAQELKADAEKGIVHDPATPEASSERALAMNAGGRIRTDLASVVDGRLTDTDVRAMSKMAERQAVIAETKANWLQKKVGEVQGKVSAMTPFFSEKAAVALARTKGIRDFANELMKGIRTLNLYTGVGVEVTQLAEGEGAAPHEPLTIMQAKLFADEEVAAHIDVDASFDFSSMPDFDALLASDPRFRDQLLPTPRCVVSMAVRRRDIDYGDSGSNQYRNEINRRVFLLVRNGGNLYRVHSAEETHERTPRLFPTKDELDRPFQGYDGTQITLNDLRFTDAARKAEDIALHYKRFLVLLCGLDHRLKLFGDFHDAGESLSFIGLAFQQRFMHFIADDEKGQLLGEGRPPVHEWMRSRNQYLQSGSRVLCFHRQLMTPNTAPACRRMEYGNKYDRVDHLAEPLKDTEVLVAYREGKEIVVDARVEREARGYTELTQKEFNARVSLTVAMERENGIGMLCLDAVDARDLMWYVRSRHDRVHHVTFIRAFKRVAAMLAQQAEREAPAMAWIEQAVRQGAFCAPEEVPELVKAAVRSWRCANRGAELPGLDDKKCFDTILSLAHSLSREGDFASMLERYAEQAGVKPLRGVLTGKNRLALYVEVPPAERDERLMPWGWVRRQTINVLRTKLSLASEKLVWLTDKPDASETEVKTWPDLQGWINKSAESVTLKDLRRASDAVTNSLTRYREIFVGKGAGIPAEAFERMLRLMRSIMVSKISPKKKTGKLVRPYISLPVAAFVETGKDRIGDVRLVCVQADAVHWLMHFGTPQQARVAAEFFAAVYVTEDYGLEEARKPFTPVLAVTELLTEMEGGLGIFMNPDSELHDESMKTARYYVRNPDPSSYYAFIRPCNDEAIVRGPDPALAFWMRDMVPAGQRMQAHRPERVLMEPTLLAALEAVDANDPHARGLLAQVLDLPLPQQQSRAQEKQGA